MCLSATPQSVTGQTPLSSTIPGVAQTHVHWVSETRCIVVAHFSFAFSLPCIRVFLNKLALCNRWPKYWSFRFSISASSEYSRLISLKIDWFDLLVVQGTLKSLLQYHNSEASILQHSVFFMVQFTSIHDCWKNHSFDNTDLCQQSDVSAF